MAPIIIQKLFKSIHHTINPTPLNGQGAQNVLIELLESSNPCMIARFGSVEVQATLWAQKILPPPISNILKTKAFRGLINNAGFFPVSERNIIAFGNLMIESMKRCDCLASWRFEEFFFKRYLKKASRIKLGCLGPGNEGFEKSWFKTLKGKKLLVVSPFAELIEMQYKSPHWNEIWRNPDILPELESLTAIKAVNSIGGNCEFESWFDALEHMKSEISKVDFDIAILGCGAYGFPLAAWIKSIGKKAVHMGGSTQLVFGIKGKRWEGRDFINKHWISPRPQDRPRGYEKVEGGCYW